MDRNCSSRLACAIHQLRNLTPDALQEIRMAAFTKCLTKPFERQAFLLKLLAKPARSDFGTMIWWNLKIVLYIQKHSTFWTGCHAGILHIIWWTSFATTTTRICLECGWTLSRTQSMNGRYANDMHAQASSIPNNSKHVKRWWVWFSIVCKWLQCIVKHSQRVGRCDVNAFEQFRVNFAKFVHYTLRSLRMC